MDDIVIDAGRVVPTVTIGALIFVLSQSVSKCAEFVFVRAFGKFDSLFKHVAFVAIVASLVLTMSIALSDFSRTRPALSEPSLPTPPPPPPPPASLSTAAVTQRWTDRSSLPQSAARGS